MAHLDPTHSNMQRAIREALAAHWRLFLFQGVVMIVLGVLAVALPVAATIAVEIYIGWLFLVSGIIGLVAMFSAHDVPAFLWSLVTAALSVAVGVMLIWNPVAGALSLTLVLAAFFIAEGVFQVATFDRLSPRDRGVMGLDAGERHLGPAVGHGDYSRLANKRRLGTGSPRWHQPAHVGLGNSDGSVCRAQSGPDGDGSYRGGTPLIQILASCGGLGASVTQEFGLVKL